MILEVVAKLLAQTAQGCCAEHVPLEPLWRVLTAGCPDDEVEAPEVGEGAQDLLHQRRPEEAGPPRKQYLLVLVRLAEQLATLLCPLAYFPFRAVQEGPRVLPVPPQNERPPDYGVEHVREWLAGEPEHHGTYDHDGYRAERCIAAKEHNRPPEREEAEPYQRREPYGRARACRHSFPAAKATAAMSHSFCTASLATTTGTRPLSISPASVSMAAHFPAARNTLAVPILPLPTFRTSTPRARPTRYPVGTEPRT